MSLLNNILSIHALAGRNLDAVPNGFARSADREEDRVGTQASEMPTYKSLLRFHRPAVNRTCQLENWFGLLARR